ncbi:uncharacterized protein LOC120281709 [Dioscorea cayenensis subsp. rotundata]|uniref:Uncharacterized protein LOC120281709 n=1 Tax=Dioscorea cayennensis subsp. rotundata TaxID=55577 RepID=A0AB40CW86_DIOCR|nr:uncharacterized protein LOC120281709 [Dioscorea cayenensis subsp. rotundata]
MASLSFSRVTLMMVQLVLSLTLMLPSALAGVICEDLPQDLCAFAISASSKRCLLESIPRHNGPTEYQCRTSEVVVDKMSNWIETDECVRACGVDRNSVGISSDALMEPHFASKLCSVACYQNCPNILDLYFNLAAGEGVFLPDLCEAQRVNPHRAMVELLSSGAAPGPVTSSEVGSIKGSAVADPSAPAPAPAQA